MNKPFLIFEESSLLKVSIEVASFFIANANMRIPTEAFIMSVFPPHLPRATAMPVKLPIKAIIAAKAGQVLSHSWNSLHLAKASARVEIATDKITIEMAALLVFAKSSFIMSELSNQRIPTTSPRRTEIPIRPVFNLSLSIVVSNANETASAVTDFKQSICFQSILVRFQSSLCGT